MMRSVCLGLVVAGLSSLCAFGQDAEVAVIVDPGGRREASGAQEFLAHMESTLQTGGLPYALVTQEQLLGGALDDFAVAIVPYAPNLGGAGLATLQAFCRDGGKVICFYTTYGLGDALGVRSTTYVPADPERTLFRRVRLNQDALPGIPAGFAQTSWNINAPSADSAGTVLGDWLKADGTEAGHAAAVLSENGFYFSHVLMPETAEDQRLAGQMLAAVVAHLGERRGTRRDIAIIYGSVSEGAGQSDSRLVRRQVEDMSRILSSAGLPFTVLPDEAVARGALHDRKVAIFPLNFTLAEGESDAVARFVEEGGKVIGCFSANVALLPFMGVESTQFTAGGQATPFQVVRFNAGAPDGFPASFAQRSSNISASTAAPDAQVIATWHDEAGADTGEPAVTLGPNGMFFSYILSPGEVDKTSQFMLAAIAHLAGDEVYVDAAERAASRLWDFRRYQDRESFLAACRAGGSADLAREAIALETAARAKLAEGDARAANEGLREARTAAEQAFIRSLPAGPEREFRGTWIHSVTIPGQDWDGFFAGMKKSHLNALLPNVCAGGYAHYESDLLPLSQFVRENGPQMEAMMAAAKKHGIEIHLWRVNWNMWWPGADVVAQYAAENRVCRDPEGDVVSGPGSASLCPSHPLNRQLEIDAMLEMTRKFHPDGIHFDYIRYPGGQACYCVGCRERFEERIARPVENWPADVLAGGALQQDYLQFRRDQITAVVREVSRRSREIDPNVKISAAVFSHLSARDSVGQDWTLWVKEGYLDFVCPMNYTQDVAGLGTTVASQMEWTGGRIPLQSGIGVWRSESAWHTADLVDTARANGADGLTFFEYRGRVVSQLIPALLEGPFRNPAKTPWAD